MKRRGFSLFEVIVSLGLLFMLLSGVALTAMIGLRYFHQTRAYTEVQQEAAKAMEWLVRDLSNAIETNLSVANGPGAWMRMLSAEPIDSTEFRYTTAGELIWQKWLGYYLSGDELRRSEVQLTDSDVTSPNPPPAPVVGLAQLQACARQRVVARRVERLNFVYTPGVRRIQVEITTQVEVDSTHSTRIQLASTVFLRNN